MLTTWSSSLFSSFILPPSAAAASLFLICALQINLNKFILKKISKGNVDKPGRPGPCHQRRRLHPSPEAFQPPKGVALELVELGEQAVAETKRKKH